MYKIGRLYIYTVLAIAIALHLTFLNYFKIFGAKPDIVLISVVFFGFFLGWRKGLEAGLVAGLIEDIFVADIFGINAFIMGISGMMAGITNMKFFKESRVTQALLVWSLAILSMSLRFLCVALFRRYVKMAYCDYLLSSIIPSGLYSSLVSIPIFSKFISDCGLQEENEGLL